MKMNGIKSDDAAAWAAEPAAEAVGECLPRKAGPQAAKPCDGATPTAPATEATEQDAAETRCLHRKSGDGFPMSRAVSDAVAHARLRRAWLAAREEESAAAATTTRTHPQEKPGAVANLRRWMAGALRAAAQVLGVVGEKP